MLNAEAATERQGWANFSTSSRAGKWLAEMVTYFSGLFGLNLNLLISLLLFISLTNNLNMTIIFFKSFVMKTIVLWWHKETVFYMHSNLHMVRNGAIF